MNELPILGVLLGNSAGVGPELVAKLAVSNYYADYCRPVIIGDVRMFEHGLKVVGGDVPHYVISDLSECDWERGYPVLDLKDQDPEQVVYGEANAYCGASDLLQLDTAIELCKAGKIEGFVFGPFHKGAMKMAGLHDESEHTYLAHAFNLTTPFCEVNMMDDLMTVRTTSHIPIILLTALNIEEKYQEGIESGADAYITKPFNVSLLLARIFKLIELRDKLRQKYSNEPGLAHSIICTNDKDQKFSVKLNEVLNEHMTDTDFSVNDFAGIMGLGRTVFYKKVRGVTGYSPYEYLRVMRMKKAAEMLLTEDLTIAEVAYSVGINDPFYFSKCFKNQFGVSPSAYRKKLSEDENEPINDADV